MVIPKIYNGRNKTFFFANLELYRNFTVTNGYVDHAYRAEENRRFQPGAGAEDAGHQYQRGAILENMIFDPTTEQTVNGQITRTPFPNNVIPVSRLNAGRADNSEHLDARFPPTPIW